MNTKSRSAAMLMCFALLIAQGVSQDHGGRESIEAPRILSEVQPEYTPVAKKAKLEGTVKVRCVVGADGNVTEPTVIQGVGMGLDENAVAAVKKWKFSPATLNKKPVRVSVIVEVAFHL
jgi:protein TonB